MSIPDKAFQAALDTMWDAHDWDEWDEPVDIAEAALKAAAPFIAAQALRDAATDLGNEGVAGVARAYLLTRADQAEQ